MKINLKTVNNKRAYPFKSIFQNMYEFKYNSYIGINTTTDFDLCLNRNLHIWIISNFNAPKLYQYINIIDSVAIIIHSDVN